jgi:deoxyadenosine/deoxycytidine kinase
MELHMFLLEGNIGVGKSTFLKLLQTHCPGIEVVQEPKDNWTADNHGQSLLGEFYKNPQRWAYTIETLAMVTRVQYHLAQQVEKNPFRVMERSVYSGHYCFAFNDYASGYLTDLEWDIYLRWVDFLVHRQCNPPRGFIYLRADHDVCYSRMRKRNRKAEEGMTQEYMAQIHEWHERFLIKKENIADYIKQVPVLILDANQNLLSDEEMLQNYIQQVVDFMHTSVVVNKPQELSL